MKDAKYVYDFEDFKNVVAFKGNCAVLEDFILLTFQMEEVRAVNVLRSLTYVK